MSFVLSKQANDLLYISLNRPQKQNAYNMEMIEQITKLFQNCNKDATKLVVLNSVKKDFCAGADFSMMLEYGRKNQIDNRNNAKKIADMYKAILNCSKPIIGVAKGNVYGGGVGLLAACDITCASKKTVLCLSESKWGLVPGIITPILISRMGPHNVKRLSICASSFDVEEGRRIGLIDYVFSQKNEKMFLDHLIKNICSNSPNAIKEIKNSFRKLANIDFKVWIEQIAKMRESEDTKKRLKQLNKRD